MPASLSQSGDANQPEEQNLSDLAASGGTHLKIPEDVQEQAATWLVDLQAAPEDIKLQKQWNDWRNAAPVHEHAWQQIESMSSQLAKLPKPLVQATLDAAGHSQSATNRRRAIKTLMVLLGVGSSAWALHRQAQWQPILADLHTDIGEMKTITLEDGSLLELNTNTAVNLAYSATERRIRLLRGEILLTSNAQSSPNNPVGSTDSPIKAALVRPLLVETRHGQAIALGTRFTVRHLPETPYTSVAVFEGKVRILPGSSLEVSQSITLHLGEAAQFSAQKIMPVQTAKLHSLAWREGMLIAENMPLPQFISQLARYHQGGRLECAPNAAAITVTGTFPLRDTQQVLNMLRATLPIRLETRNRLLGTTTVLLKR